MKETIYLSIDLKSFFANCECVERQIDPNKEAIVIANPHQGNGAITLAITPFLKKQGVKSRCRLYEIPWYINYKIIPPNMQIYKKYSEKVYNVYTEFFSEEDIHKYSIDECFIDITPYLTYYNKTEVELAQEILKKIYMQTGLTASCGIGNSIFLAKVAMDTQAKNNEDAIAYFKKNEIKDNLWKIKNLEEVWNIGPSTGKKLNNMQIYTGYDLAKTSKKILKDKLGILGEELHNNFNGIYTTTIQSLNKEPKNKSYSHSRHLLNNHTYEELKPIIFNMASQLEEILITDKKTFKTINIKITYDDINNKLNKTITIEKPEYTSKIIYEIIINYLTPLKIKDYIRKIDINLQKIEDKTYKQLTIFEKEENNNDDISNIMHEINLKHGKNKIIKAGNLIENK